MFNCHVCVSQCNLSETRAANVIEEDNSVGSIAWNSPGNAIGSDNARATASAIILGDKSYLMKLKDFRFTIPAGATVCGVQVHIEGSASGLLHNVHDEVIQLVVDDTADGDDLAIGSTWPTSDAVMDFGDTNETWSIALNPALVNDSNFGVSISVDLSGISVLPTARIDHVELSVFYSAAILPIELVSFTGNVTDNRVVLNWTTATELNNDYFLIESSIDGVHWDHEAVVYGAGHSTERINYSLEIENTMNHYFRLSQTDYNGETEYFNPIFLSVNHRESGVKISPNPTKGEFSISAAELSRVSIVNSSGLILIDERFEGEGPEIGMNVSDIPSGLYYVQAFSETGQMQVEKLIKQ
ncbi:MAG: hypothetical protein Salg2KO_20690 [Salibacteraceae bacterium]